VVGGYSSNSRRMATEVPEPAPSAPALGLGEEVKIPTICLIGATGTGKSTTANTLFKQMENDLFMTSGQMNSTTFEPRSETRPWRGTMANVRCVDTPGLGDTEGRDSDHVRLVAEMLKDYIKYVHVFLVFFNAEDPKLNIHLKEMLVTFRDSFGQDFLRNVMICFTHWEYDRKAKLKRKKHGGTNEKKSSMINSQLRETLGHDYDCPCVFMDNTLNLCDDEELHDLYEDELPAISGEFESELDKIHKFATRSEPFCCRDVEATLAATDALRSSVKAWLQLSHLVACETLGRRLILAEQDIISKGWLRFRRRRVWAVLRRQHLRFYTDESCSEATGPEAIDLTGCICVDHQRLLGVGFGYYFTIYKPLKVDYSETASRSELTAHDFRVESEKERKRWVLLVGEATQISESCHRIQKLYEALRSAQSEPEYVKAVSGLSNKTMLIPVEWVRQCSAALEGQFREYKPPSMKQVEKDLSRDNVMVETREFNCPRGDDLAIVIARNIVKALTKTAKEDELAEAKATVLARDAILSCSRSEGGGDTFDALNLLFGVDLVHIVPDSRAAEPVRVRIFHENSGLDTTGVPEFEGDDSTKELGLEMVRAMVMEGEQRLGMTAVGRDMWVADADVPQCMRCGVPFTAFLRRHHCRACGALICFGCSRHSVHDVKRGSFVKAASAAAGDVAAGLPPAKASQAMRVCFLCYQRAVIDDLKLRKAVGEKERFAEDGEGENSGMDGSEGRVRMSSADGDEDKIDSSPSSSSSPVLVPASFTGAATEAEDVALSDFPAVSVEMGSRYKVCSQDPISEADSVLFHLDCRYVRVVRWSGLADSGRIFISIIPKEPK